MNKNFLRVALYATALQAAATHAAEPKADAPVSATGRPNHRCRTCSHSCALRRSTP